MKKKIIMKMNKMNNEYEICERKYYNNNKIILKIIMK